jgi:hypothetical protein
MKYVLTFSLVLFLSGNCFALQFSIFQPEPGTEKNQPGVKGNSGEKKIIKTPPGKEQGINSQKIKKATAAEDTEFYGPLSWKPRLLF